MTMTTVYFSEVKAERLPFRMPRDPAGQAHAFGTGDAVRLTVGALYLAYDGQGMPGVWRFAADAMDCELVALVKRD
jgi:hypothetical protein